MLSTKFRFIWLTEGFQRRRLKCEKFQKKYSLDPCSKENLDVGFSFYFIFQNGWKPKAFHSFWTFLPFLNPKILSGPPFKKVSFRPPLKKNWTWVPIIFPFFRMAENKKHFIHFVNFYPKIIFETHCYKKKFRQGFPLYFSFYIRLKTKCTSLILSI